MFVMTIDQRGSSADIDRVPGLLAELSGLGFAGFERSVGDELQGVVSRAADAVDVALHVLRTGRWYVGIGVGKATVPDGGSPREGTGSAFIAARKAVEAAKAAGSHVPLSVVAGTLAKQAAGRVAVMAAGKAAVKEGSLQATEVEGANAADLCADAQAVLRLIGKLRQERTGAQWKVVDIMQELEAAQAPGNQKQVARRLGVTEQSVSRTLLRSGWQEEKAARPAAARLLAFANDAVLGANAGGA